MRSNTIDSSIYNSFPQRLSVGFGPKGRVEFKICIIIGLRFYAGAPIITPDGFNIGTVCVVDKKPRPFSKEDEELLKLFAKAAMDAIEDRRKNLIYN